MALTTIPLPYGLRDVRLTPYTDAAATVLGTPVDLPNARTLSFTASEEFTELRGDDKVVTTVGHGEAVAWSLESGGISLEAFKVLSGATIVETGTTPAQKKSLKKKVTDIRPWFQIEGQIISNSGGDFHAVIFKCKATGNLGGSFGDSTFLLTSASGVGLPSTKTGDLDSLYELIQNETAVVIA